MSRLELRNFGKIANANALPNAVTEGLINATTRGFGRAIGDTREHLHADRLFVVEDRIRREGDPSRYKGFAAITFGSLKTLLGEQFPDERGCYFSGSVLDKEVQGKGLYPRLNDMRVAAGLTEGVSLFANRTQNGRVADETLHAFDRAVSSGKIEGFTFEKILLPRVYQEIGGMLTSKLPPKATDPRIQRVYGLLNVKEGDAMGFIIRVSPRV